MQIAEAQGSRRRVLVVPRHRTHWASIKAGKSVSPHSLQGGFRAPFVLLTIGQSIAQMDRHYERPLPETITKILDDGCIAISVGDFTGVVSSMHLIEPKAHQLQSAWLAREAELSNAR